MKSEASRMINRNFSEELSTPLENWINLSEENRKNILQNIYRSLELQNYPFYESDSIVTLVYKGNCQKVELLSDITGWTDPISFKKLNGTDIFYIKLELESDARIQYLLIVDGNAVCDPFNKYKPINGLGSHSELAMPGYMRHHYHNDFLYGEEGSYEGLIKHTLIAGALPYDHEVHVFLPPDYTKKNKYPTVYFHDGPDYIRFGLAPYSINRLIVEKYIESCIAVFVTPPNLHQPIEPNRSTEYGMNNDYVKFFCDELVNFIDNNYSTLRLPQERLVIGDSYAGLISLYITLSRTDVFRKCLLPIRVFLF